MLETHSQQDGLLLFIKELDNDDKWSLKGFCLINEIFLTYGDLCAFHLILLALNFLFIVLAGLYEINEVSYAGKNS